MKPQTGWEPSKARHPAQISHLQDQLWEPPGRARGPLARYPSLSQPAQSAWSFTGPSKRGRRDRDLRSYPWPGPEQTGGCLAKALPYAGGGRAARPAQHQGAM